MSKRSYAVFVRRYLARGAIGVSVGLAAIGTASAATHQETTTGEPPAASFSERLSLVRAAVSKHVEDTAKLAQVIPHPPPAPAPFRNFFGKQPFSDAWKNAK